MSEKEAPSVPMTPDAPPVEAPSEGYLKLAAALNTLAQSNKELGEKKVEAERLRGDLERERQKNRVIRDTSNHEAPTLKGSLSEIMESEPANDWERDVKDRAVRIRTLMEIRQANRRSFDDLRNHKWGKELSALLQKATHWDTGTDTAGADWVPTLHASSFMDFFQLEPVIASQFPSINIPRGTGAFRVPMATSATTVDIVTEGSSAATTLLVASAGQPGTDYVTLTPAKHRGGITLNQEMIEDASFDVLGWSRMQLSKDMALALDDALLNGQPGGDTNLDGSNSTAPANGYFATANTTGNSLRFFAHATPGSNNTSLGGVLESEDVMTARQNMGKFGVNPQDLRLIVSPSAYLQLVADATDNNVTTVEKYGAAATIATGELAKVWGIPVIVSDRMHENMNTGGDLNSSTSTTTGAILVNVTRWVLGISRNLELRVVPSPANDQVGLYGFLRSGFNNAFVSGDDGHTWYIYNIT